MNRKAYQAFFKKRIQTQSFLDKEMNQTSSTNLTNKILSQLKNAHRETSKKQQRVNKVVTKIKTIQNQEEMEREKLREKIQSRMRNSQTNLQKLSSARKKQILSRSESYETRNKKIKQKINHQLEISLIEMHKNREQSQKFFRQTQSRRDQQFKRQQNIQKCQATRYDSFYLTKYNDTQQLKNLSKSRSSLSGSSLTKNLKPRVHVLKVDDKEIAKKLEKKHSIQQQKQQKYLVQYAKKLQNIYNIRSKSTKPKKEQSPTLPKVVNREHDPLSRQRKSKQKSPAYHSYHHSLLNSSQNRTSNTQQKIPFSEMYITKLNEMKGKKQIWHDISLKQGNQILQKQHEQTKLLKQNKIIKQSVNDYKRWSHLVATFKNHHQ